MSYVLFSLISLTAVAAFREPAALSAPATPGTQPSATAEVVRAANAFLATLDDKQRAAVLFKFNDDKQRARWSNFPTGFVPRGGLSLKELSDRQRSAAMALVAAALSDPGFKKVQQIMNADEVLKATDKGPGGGGPGGPGGPDHHDNRGGPGARGGAGGAGGAMFGRDLYYLSFLGTPSEKDAWMLQFGGHHLALNITIIGERGIFTPSLTGAQPALYQAIGKTIRPLGQESDKGLALLNALDDAQRKQAILNYHVADLVFGPGQDGKFIQPEGLKVSVMNEKQRALLLDVISEWSGIVNDSYVVARMDEIKASLDDTYFAWSGPTTADAGKNITAYYRIQGPKLVIEYSPQRIGGDLSLHVHTIYRDPTNDYGQGVGKP